MMQSISHWGQFEMQAPGTDHLSETLQAEIAYARSQGDKSIDYQYDAKYLHKFY